MQYGIVGTGSYLPSLNVSNQQMELRLGISADWIAERTGILDRRVAAAHEATSDCALAAAKEALADAGITPCELDYVIVGTSTPDFPQPATATLVQRDLGAMAAAAFDVNAVCTSFVYALDVARGLLLADDKARYALVIGADVYSRVLDYTDRRSCVLFGDGAGAVVLGAVPDNYGFLTSRLLTDGTLEDLVKVPAGGSRTPACHATVASGQHLFQMQGHAVKQYVESMFPELLCELLKDANLELSDVDLVVPHQANGKLLARVADLTGLPREKVHTTVERYGNTGAASIPVTLKDAQLHGKLRPGAIVALIGFGGGMTAGGSLHRWAPSPFGEALDG